MKNNTFQKNNSFPNNQLLQYDNQLVRVLDSTTDKVFIIDCIKKTMPVWTDAESLKDYLPCSEDTLQEITDTVLIDLDNADSESRKTAYERYTMIAPLLPFVSDQKKRKELINSLANINSVSKQTIRYYLCLYLVYQNISILIRKQSVKESVLSQDEKNMRWALNKFFYTKHKNSLPVAYTLLLKEKYCDSLGSLLPEYPSFYQFRYFYRRAKKMQTYYISRDGLKDYQKNNRPLLGDGIQEYASSVGMGMLDATVCDIYLVNEVGNLVGRPILTACIDAYSSLCCGYSLSWEGGVYSLRGLMLNIISDKQKWCNQYGISIEKSQWDADKLPAIFVTDMGSEYKSENFEQITELGVTVVNLPSYRPELKGTVEKFFDLVQNTYKPHLKGKGVIEPDYQERGSHDYRKDACLTMADFEKVILRCIIYCNSQRIIENFPYTEGMIQNQIQPFASNIWEWVKAQTGANLITVDKEQIVLTLLPRTTGKFSRFGLRVNKMRYKHENFTEKYLSGGEVTVAYNPDDVSEVWLIDNGSYIRFNLIESRYKGKELSDVEIMQRGQKELVKAATADNIQAQINLAQSIEIIAASVNNPDKVNIKSIRNGTGNPAKLDAMRHRLADLGIELVGLKELSDVRMPEIVEDGFLQFFERVMEEYYKMERYELRTIRQDEMEQGVAIELACFPPNEACSEKSMRERVQYAPELFLAAVDKKTGKIAGTLNGLATNETKFRDAFFDEISLYEPMGENVMLLGLSVLPEYRGQGIARALMEEYSRREQKNGRKQLILTCLQDKVEMYKKMNFRDEGISASTWGGEEWHDMTRKLND